MRELKENFIGTGQVKGFKFTQLEKSCNAYLYQITIDNTIHYEVFHRKENNRFNCVSYPSNKAFGLWAWTYKNLQTAKDKFDDICLASEVNLNDF